MPTPFLPVLVESQAVLPLEENATQDRALDWQDITTYVRKNNLVYDGTVLALPLDGDLILLYYRQDVLNEFNLQVPNTWAEWLELARRFNGTDMNEDGKNDFGTCLGRKPGEQSQS